MKVWILIFVLASTWSHIEAQDALDAPLVPKPPTVRSELKRGWDAGNSCTLLSTLPMDPAYQCVERLQAENRQRQGQGFEPFDTGIFFNAILHFSILISVLTGPDEKELLAEAQGDELVCWATYSEARKLSGISDDDVFRALNPGTKAKSLFNDAMHRHAVPK